MTPFKRRADLSAHRLAMFDLCPKRQRLTYQDGRYRRSDVSVGLARGWAKGKAFHKALEDAAWARRRHDALPAVPTEEELLAYVDDRAVQARLTPDEHEDVRQAAVAGRAMFDMGNQLLDPETAWVCELAPAIWAEGRYDLVSALGARVVARDWKLGKADPPTQVEARQLPQVGLYLVDLHARFPEADGWEVWLVYVRHQAVVRVTWEPALDRLWRGRGAAAVRAWRRGYALATPGEHCADCEVRDGCQAWLDLEGLSEEDALQLGDELLLAERQAAKAREVTAKRRRIDCDKEIRRRLGGGARALRAGGLEATLREREAEEVAAEAVVELAARRGEDVAGMIARTADVSSRKVRKLVQNDEEARLVARWTRTIKRKHVNVRRVKA